MFKGQVIVPLLEAFLHKESAKADLSLDDDHFVMKIKQAYYAGEPVSTFCDGYS